MDNCIQIKAIPQKSEQTSKSGVQSTPDFVQSELLCDARTVNEIHSEI